jgi:hypothetical protein
VPRPDQNRSTGSGPTKSSSLTRAAAIGCRSKTRSRWPQEAIRRFFDPDYVRYDPDLHGTVLNFLGSIANAIAANTRRRGSSAKWFLGFANDQEQPRSPEQHAIAKERFERVLAKLLERTKHDSIAQKLLAVVLDGAEGIEQEAERVGVSVAEIEKALRRLKAHIETITNSLGEN